MPGGKLPKKVQNKKVIIIFAPKTKWKNIIKLKRYL